jgi:hypothetical protein
MKMAELLVNVTEKEVRATTDHIKNTILNRGATDYDEYSYLCGQLQGYDMALQILHEKYVRIVKGDEDDD